jgi:hypothetical protein
MLFIAGFFFDYLDIKVIKKLFLYIWIVFTLFIFYNLNIFISSFFLYDVKFEKVINYIFITNGYLFFSIFVLCFIEKALLKVLIWIITLIVLFFVPSRSNTFLFIFATLFPLLFNLKRLLYSIPLIILFFLSDTIFSSIDSDLFTNSRTLNIDIEGDLSLAERQYQASKNIENLKSTWFFGDFMGDVRIHGEDGHETHSYISFWEQFGIIPFFLLLISVSTLLYYLYLLRYDNSFIYMSTLILSLFFIPGMIFAKGFSSNLIWFMIPRIVVYYQSLKYGELMNQTTKSINKSKTQTIS